MHVNLAVDMVTLHPNYDLAIIVSGDQDYVPAAQAVKNLGKSVVNVAFLARSGLLLPGGAARGRLPLHLSHSALKHPLTHACKFLLANFAAIFVAQYLHLARCESGAFKDGSKHVARRERQSL
jgi:hypothetical protein